MSRPANLAPVSLVLSRDVDHGGVQIERVTGEHIEAAKVILQNAFDEAKRSIHLFVTKLKHLRILNRSEPSEKMAWIQKVNLLVFRLAERIGGYRVAVRHLENEPRSIFRNRWARSPRWDKCPQNEKNIPGGDVNAAAKAAHFKRASWIRAMIPQIPTLNDFSFSIS